MTATATATPSMTITSRQAGFLTNLLAERDLTTVTDLDALAAIVDHRAGLAITKTAASTAISVLLAAPKKTPAAAAPTTGKATAATGITEDGMYLRPAADGGEPTIFKVQKAVHGSGHLYAKQLVPLEFGKVRFDYAPGAVATLTPAMKMTLEQAIKYGALYGTCVRCGRTLTAEKSIAAAMGPVCRSKF